MNHIHLHPIIVHFPIALFITALGLEVLSLLVKKEVLHKAALCNYFLAILASVGAVLVAWWEGAVLYHPVFYSHRIFAYWTTGIALASAVILPLAAWRFRKAFRVIFFVFLILCAGLVSVAGYYGGRLVYEYGVGVEG